MLDRNISAVDLFCGIGGLSYGLKQSGITIKAGFDFDSNCQYAYEANCEAPFIHKDIVNITKEEINAYYDKDDIKILLGCAPCQPFSTYTLSGDKQKDQRWQLLYEFSRLIKETKPDIVSMENVPNLLNFKKEPVFENFVKELKDDGYFVWYKVVYSPDYGIPQKRKRLVLLGSKKGKIELINPTHTKQEYITVKDAIGELEELNSGESSKKDFIHRASKLSDKNIERLKQSVQGGSWRDWDKNIVLECHKKKSGKTYGSVYGRMKWDEPSPTMTTFCTGIGNAVPPRLGEVIGISIIKHIEEMEDGKS